MAACRRRRRQSQELLRVGSAAAPWPAGASWRYRIMNETFRRFVLQAAPADTVKAWEREGVQMSWANVRTGMTAAAIMLAILAVLTQYQLLTTWIGYLPALAPVVPMVMRLLAKDETGNGSASSVRG